MGINQAKKELLCKFQDMKCEECHKIFTIDKLEIHRIKHGDYSNHRTLKVVCKKCHDFYSSADRITRGIQGK